MKSIWRNSMIAEYLKDTARIELAENELMSLGVDKTTVKEIKDHAISAAKQQGGRNTDTMLSVMDSVKKDILSGINLDVALNNMKTRWRIEQ